MSKGVVGIGTDIAEVNRFEQILLKNKEAFFIRVLTKKEQERLSQKKHQAPHLAGLYAAKEAVSKALGTGLYPVLPTEIEIVKDEAGKPGILLTGKANEKAKELNIEEVQISISHEREYAVAFAIALG